jgi:osmoprotectant transport system ATP-binding protein
MVRSVDAVLTLEGISKSFAGVTAVRVEELTAATGETLVLIGASGSGKSTLLRLMVGLLRPDAGSVRLGSTRVTPTAALALRRRMGYVIQDGGLFPHLTARGNVTLMAGHVGWDARRIEARLAELCDLTKFPADGLDRYPAQISGGQRQRVSLMRALFLDPEILFLDEPLGALDPLIRSDLQTDLRAIFRRLDKTVVLVTHDLAEARYFADRIVLLHEGRVVQEGTYEELDRSPAEEFVTRFLTAQRTLTAGSAV